MRADSLTADAAKTTMFGSLGRTTEVAPSGMSRAYLNM